MFFIYTIALYIEFKTLFFNFIFEFLMDFIIYEGFINLHLVIVYASINRKYS